MVRYFYFPLVIPSVSIGVRPLISYIILNHVIYTVKKEVCSATVQ